MRPLLPPRKLCLLPRPHGAWLPGLGKARGRWDDHQNCMACSLSRLTMGGGPRWHCVTTVRVMTGGEDQPLHGEKHQASKAAVADARFCDATNGQQATNLGTRRVSRAVTRHDAGEIGRGGLSRAGATPHHVKWSWQERRLRLSCLSQPGSFASCRTTPNTAEVVCLLTFCRQQAMR